MRSVHHNNRAHGARCRLAADEDVLDSANRVNENSIVAATTATWGESQNSTGRTTAARRYFYVHSPLRAFFGRAIAGGLRAAGFLVHRSLNPAFCSPTPFESGARVYLHKEAIMAYTSARSEQSISPEHCPLFSRAGTDAASLWLQAPPLSLVEYRDKRLRHLLEAVGQREDLAGCMQAFHRAYERRIAAYMASSLAGGTEHA
jgi:hypothetical protein